MDDKRRNERLKATRDSARHLAEDLSHIREIVAKDQPSSAEVRRLSAVLRRILVDGDLVEIAAPRIGRVEILAPENTPLYRSGQLDPFLFLASAGVTVFGVEITTAMIDRGPVARDLPGYNPEGQTLLKADAFAKQRTLCLGGEWATRADAIKYIANVASGVHSGSPNSDNDQKIARIRKSASAEIEDGMLTVSFNPQVAEGEEPPLEYNPAALDFVLLDLLATGRLLTEAADVIRLEEYISSE